MIRTLIFLAALALIGLSAGQTAAASSMQPALQSSTPPVIPVISADMQTYLRRIFLRGRRDGNQPGVFIKVGDSITASDWFLKGIGCYNETLADYTDLDATIRYFRQTGFEPVDQYGGAWCDIANSFTRTSVAAGVGWNTYGLLARYHDPHPDCPEPDNAPLKCEIHLMQPSIALIMFGTNDLSSYNNLDYFRYNLATMVQICTDHGVIPILSTIPPRLDSPEANGQVPDYNRMIAEVAQSYNVPLWNYWLALQGAEMVNQGMGPDGIHPSVYHHDSANFTPEALVYGYNMRNLTALQALDHVRRVVIDNGAPDAG